MKEVDHIVVGLGIAGIALCESLRKRGKRFVVFDAGTNASTSVAGGVVNPVVIKRINPVWNAKVFLTSAQSFYRQINDHLDAAHAQFLQVSRPFASVEELNAWSVAGDRPDLDGLIDPEPTGAIPGIHSELGMGDVLGTLHVDTVSLRRDYAAWLRSQQLLIETPFDYAQLTSSASGVSYGAYQARRILFAEGVAGRNNPYFPTEALLPKKGEYITIHAPALQLRKVVKGAFFVIPLGGHNYKVGATFAHGDQTPEITEKGRQQMTAKLDQFLSVPYEVIDQVAGFRPTVSDRRPLLGCHPTNDAIAFLNGLGTRGLLMAPMLADWLLDHLETGAKLPDEVDIARKF